MAPQSLDFSDLGARPVAPQPQSNGSLDFSDLGAKRLNLDSEDDGSSGVPSTWDKVTSSYDPGAAEFDQKHPILGKGVRAMSSLGGTVLSIPQNVYHAFADDPTPEETEKYGADEVTGAKRIGLGLERMIGQPIENAWQDYSNPATRPTLKQAMSVAPEAIGTGAGTYIGSEIGARGVRAIPRIPGAVTDAALNFIAKGKAVARVATQDAMSRVPVAGRLVRRPSVGDYWKAVTAKAAPMTGEVMPPSTDQVPGRPYVPRPRAVSPYAQVERGLMLPGAAERVPLWKQAGIEPGPPPSSVDATPSAPYKPVRAPQPQIPEQQPVKLIEKVQNAEDVTPALTGKAPSYYETDEQAWQRYPQAGSREDVADTRSLQEKVRDQFNAEQRGRLSRGNEEGFTRNTRPRTPKGELQQRFQNSRTLLERARAAAPEPETTPTGDDLLPLLEESVRRARLKQ